jgi:hypothetical protein
MKRQRRQLSTRREIKMDNFPTTFSLFPRTSNLEPFKTQG